MPISVPKRLIPCLSVLAVLPACSDPGRPVDLRFEAMYGAETLACGTRTSGPVLTDLRFYVHDVALRDADGAWQALTLTPGGPWQQERLGLVDLEDAAGTCLNGTPDIHAVLAGTAPAGDYDGLRFVLGVPFEVNHADPLSAAPPLDDPAMHWHWRAGYKFLRAGLDTADDGFWLHLGSAGCEGTVQNITGCRYPNRVTVELAGFDPELDSVAFDFEALLAGTDLEDGEPGDCASGPPETACRAPFDALGIDHASGAATAPQSVFRRRRR